MPMIVDVPDFDYMNQLAREAAEAKADIKMLEAARKHLAAKFMLTHLQDKSLWIQGKYPTGVVLEKIVAEVGNSPDNALEMEVLNSEIADAHRRWEEAFSMLQTCRDKISIYQTESANKRLGIEVYD